MPNLYRETAEPAAPAAPLEGTEHADVLVIGGGFTGLSAALHLAERGVKVVVLEAEEPGWGASGRNGGQVNPGLKPDPDVVERDFGAELGRRMNALAGSAPDQLFALVERLNIACDARRNGTLRAAVHASHAAAIRRTAQQWDRRGAPVEVLEGPALVDATGTPRYLAALLDRRGGDLHPLRYARGLARAAATAGAQVHGRSRALRLGRAGSRWCAATPGGRVIADQVVLATNGYTDDVWPALRRSVVPLFGAMTASAPLPAALARSILPSRSVLYESGSITVYYRVDAAARLLLGGRGPQREVSAIAEVPYLPAYARKLWPQLAAVEWTHAWGGRLAMTRDHYPHLHEPAPGLLACLGYNGRGVALATALGAQIATRILDRGAALDMPLSGVKPIALHAAWPLAVRAAIARGRFRDWLGR